MATGWRFFEGFEALYALRRGALAPLRWSRTTIPPVPARMSASAR
ncbi:MAG: hypothetical protein AVDCRST_MAG77-2889 [uncultured Chloroflexi bacterium]|uniref:Uncharacterized protein n=1 Tax=uncultured Chloroflexota bacterium TaxID=166587 RepID=A0A6J4J092_9CHLR|nr:MAG: hypothetical protein AVDCRST_MAG77-2889 [uncultured Chloroflexota bacterium]